MNQPKKGDSDLVAHARRELEMANLFTVNKENDYDGFIGKGVLAMVKLFEQWTRDDAAKMQAVSSVFEFLIKGDLLSPPTNDPDEWEEFAIDEHQVITRNKRNNMYITRDGMETWFNLRTEQKGICNDHKTGKPLEGVEDPNGKTEQAAQDQESTADADNAGDGADAEKPTAPEVEPGSASEETVPAGSEKMEGGELDSGVEPEGEKDQGKTESPAEEPQTGEK